MPSVSDYLSSKSALVMTPDGRQVTQAQYDSERQRADQTAKLNSLISAPLAAGAYGALDQFGANPETRDRITGILAGTENIAQAGGGMGMPRQSASVAAPTISVKRTTPGSVGNRFRPPPSNLVGFTSAADKQAHTDELMRAAGVGPKIDRGPLLIDGVPESPQIKLPNGPAANADNQSGSSMMDLVRSLIDARRNVGASHDPTGRSPEYNQRVAKKTGDYIPIPSAMGAPLVDADQLARRGINQQSPDAQVLPFRRR